MRSVRPLLLVALLLPLLIATASAQQIRFIPDFSNPANLQLNGSQVVPYNDQNVLRLTQLDPPFPAATSSYFALPQPILSGFTTYFSFQMHNPTQCCNPGDGFAFILQNSHGADGSQGATGNGLHAVGAADGGVGYSGLNNSLAIEFDILDNPWDPNSNHIAIQTCGGNPAKFNSPVHVPGDFTIGNNDHVTSCLLSADAINSNLPSPLGPICSDGCSDGPVHQVVVEYTPPTGDQTGRIDVYLDPVFQPGTHTPIRGTVPVISAPYNFLFSGSNPLGLTPANLNTLFVGFTASTENGGTTTDILQWEFTPHSPLQVTHIIPDGGIEQDYSFGGHQFGVTYPLDFRNPKQITMTVLETPTDQQVFHDTRLVGTQFENQECIIYLQTGGNCVVYSVTCHNAAGMLIPCPSEPDPTIDICSQYYTSLPVGALNTDLLETDPIGSNNWCSIFTGFSPLDPRDSISSGRGSGFSDVVATLSPTGPGPACFPDLKTVTKNLEKTTAKKLNNGSGSGFCNTQ